MNGMVDSPDVLGDDSCTVTGIRAIDVPGEGLVEVEITVGCSGNGRARRPVRTASPAFTHLFTTDRPLSTAKEMIRPRRLSLILKSGR